MTQLVASYEGPGEALEAASALLNTQRPYILMVFDDEKDGTGVEMVCSKTGPVYYALAAVTLMSRLEEIVQEEMRK